MAKKKLYFFAQSALSGKVFGEISMIPFVTIQTSQAEAEEAAQANVLKVFPENQGWRNQLGTSLMVDDEQIKAIAQENEQAGEVE